MNYHCLAAAAVLIAAGPVAALAQDYPGRPIKLMVGFPQGGPNDILGRMAADWLGRQLGQPVEVENKAGSSGNIATEAVVRAAPDGYTLLLVGPANAISGSLGQNLPFNFLRDIEPIGGVTREALALVVYPQLPVQTASPEVIAAAKAKPGAIRMASTGNASSPHLSGEMFKQMAGVDLRVIHYGGGGPALKAMIAGEADVMFEPMSASIEPVRSGKLRAIAVTTSSPSAALPTLPVMARDGARLRRQRRHRAGRAERNAGRHRRSAEQGTERCVHRCRHADPDRGDRW